MDQAALLEQLCGGLRLLAAGPSKWTQLASSLGLPHSCSKGRKVWHRKVLSLCQSFPPKHSLSASPAIRTATGAYREYSHPLKQPSAIRMATSCAGALPELNIKKPQSTPSCIILILAAEGSLLQWPCSHSQRSINTNGNPRMCYYHSKIMREDSKRMIFRKGLYAYT